LFYIKFCNSKKNMVRLPPSPNCGVTRKRRPTFRGSFKGESQQNKMRNPFAACRAVLRAEPQPFGGDWSRRSLGEDGSFFAKADSAIYCALQIVS
jgi:hypothetical protein